MPSQQISAQSSEKERLIYRSIGNQGMNSDFCRGKARRYHHHMQSPHKVFDPYGLKETVYGELGS
jgi:hypothetical protein